ncbi:MAG: Uma2 family endonuclease [Armatimonadetes bacterium]|nr:Uma2 family endonuclease [Armatimonadota bacterium]
MSLAVSPVLMTAEEFARIYAEADVRAELVKGRVVEMPLAHIIHGLLWAEVFDALRAWVRPRNLGLVTGADSGFVLSRNPDTVRGPDVAFVSWARLGEWDPRRYVEGAPELAVEVVTKEVSRARLFAKVADYFGAGVLVVWVFWAKSERVLVCRQNEDELILGPGDSLTCEDILPGFSLPVEQVFAAARQQPPATDDGGGCE